VRFAVQAGWKKLSLFTWRNKHNALLAKVANDQDKLPGQIQRLYTRNPALLAPRRFRTFAPHPTQAKRTSTYRDGVVLSSLAGADSIVSSLQPFHEIDLHFMKFMKSGWIS
jgi:hypothetical protein